MNDTQRPIEGEHVGSVFDFVRRYRLAKDEENRLLNLHGPTAPFGDLLGTAHRCS